MHENIQPLPKHTVRNMTDSPLSGLSNRLTDLLGEGGAILPPLLGLKNEPLVTFDESLQPLISNNIVSGMFSLFTLIIQTYSFTELQSYMFTVSMWSEDDNNVKNLPKNVKKK